MDGLRFEGAEEVAVGAFHPLLHADWPEVRDDKRDMPVEEETTRTGAVVNKTVVAARNALEDGTGSGACNCLLHSAAR